MSESYKSVMRKLRTIEMNRLSVDDFKNADKMPLVVVLDDVRSMYNDDNKMNDRNNHLRTLCILAAIFVALFALVFSMVALG